MSSWYRFRGYPHFDYRLSEAQASKIATNRGRVSKHSFYPFIRFKLYEHRPRPQHWRGIKKRPVMVASHADAHIFAYYSHLLMKEYEKELQESDISSEVIAFRSGTGLCNIDYARQAFEAIRSLRPCWILALDIRSYFDFIPHGPLKSVWKELLGVASLPRDHYSVYKAITRATWVDKAALLNALEISSREYARTRGRLCTPSEFRNLVRGKGLIKSSGHGYGIPQGSPVSALLSNIVLLSFDKEIGSLVRNSGGMYRRYCDDILIVLPASCKQRVEERVRISLGRLNLVLNESKSDVFYCPSSGKIESPEQRCFQYLGFEFDGESVRVRRKTITRFSKRLDEGVALAKKSARKANLKRSRRHEAPRPLYLHKLYERYSHLGRRSNFVRYGLRASAIMESESIRRQMARQWWRLRRRLR